MGDRRKQALRIQFDGKLRLEFHGAKIMNDAGLLAFRELTEAFRLTERTSTVLLDGRRGRETVSDPRSAQVECSDALRAPASEESNGKCRLVAGGMGGVSMSQASQRQLPPKCM